MYKLKRLGEWVGVEFLQYQPGIFRLYAPVYGSEERPYYYSRIIHRIRMIRELFFAHYVVVYMRKAGEIVGHLVVSRGGTRIAASTPEDIVLGPIWIVPSQRGQGLASTGIHAVLHELGFSYRYAFEFIEEENIASIRTVEKNGYRLIERCREFGCLKTLRPAANGKYLLYRYDRSE